RQRAADRTKRGVERELPHPERRLAGRSAMPVGGQQSDRHRQVETCAVLPDVGGSEVEDNAMLRDLEAGRWNRRAQSLDSLANRAVGKPDRTDRRKPAGEIDFDLDDPRIDAGYDGPGSATE